MKVLTEGKIRTEDFADWFNVCLTTFKRNKSLYMQWLKYAADYELYYGGIEIKSIYVGRFSTLRDFPGWLKSVFGKLIVFDVDQEEEEGMKVSAEPIIAEYFGNENFDMSLAVELIEKLGGRRILVYWDEINGTWKNLGLNEPLKTRYVEAVERQRKESLQEVYKLMKWYDGGEKSEERNRVVETKMKELVCENEDKVLRRMGDRIKVGYLLGGMKGKLE